MATMMSIIFIGCKKDEGLSEAQKETYTKFFGVAASGVDFKQTADGGYIMVGNSFEGGVEHVVLVKADLEKG